MLRVYKNCADWTGDTSVVLMYDSHEGKGREGGGVQSVVTASWLCAQSTYMMRL